MLTASVSAHIRERPASGAVVAATPGTRACRSALATAPELSPFVGVLVAGLFVAAAAARFAGSYHDLRELRSATDRIILRSDDLQPSALVVWRSGELTSIAHRRALAGDIRRILRASNERVLPGAMPLNRRLVRANEDELRELADRLEGSVRDLNPRGVLLVEALLSNADSPLYDRDRSHRFARELKAISRALDARNPPA